MTSNKKEINKIKERGILFNTEMVRAVLCGNKTQTRRIVKDVWHVMPDITGEPLSMFRFKYYKGSTTSGDPIKIECPYGKVGDLLYVRETFCILPEEPLNWIYKEKNERLFNLYKSNSNKPHLYNWKPSIHMKKEYARIWLKIKSIKFERLQEISENDAIAEGVHGLYPGAFDYPEEEFCYVWNSINKDSGNGWNTNPYVWIIEFERYYK